ncbi:collagen binding domain-containing protein [Apilactobacillus kunkeei]|uniref:collagen binding domain-containing protein n=1 Tax=Apilactobacillus kunkeei TaxID=148814 RepID=UPI000708B0E9|nr:collagen binding domain-containing protein [Apilactobacillus kunkeei]
MGQDRTLNGGIRIMVKKVITLFVFACLGLFFFNVSAHADDLTKQINSSYQVSDSQGKDVTNQNNLDYYTQYKLKYHWNMRDDVNVKENDNIQLSIPQNVRIDGANSFPAYNNDNIKVGTVNVNNSTASLTFNGSFLDKKINRQGDINLNVSGKNIDHKSKKWFVNKTGWFKKDDHKQITWNVAFNPNHKDLNNVKLTDSLGNNQKYVAGSVKATSGYWDENNNFIADNKTVPAITVNQVNNNLEFSFAGAFNNGINLTYNTDANGNPNGDVYKNTVAISGQGTENVANTSVSASVSFGGNANVKYDQAKPTNPNDNNNGNNNNGNQQPNNNCQPQPINPCRPHRVVYQWGWCHPVRHYNWGCGFFNCIDRWLNGIYNWFVPRTCYSFSSNVFLYRW